ncbi:MAG: DUF2243 domain-containing protein [Chloroflexota bacterium]|nr:DUF2243 domain-containing protein [Chloroflexota bacterium]
MARTATRGQRDRGSDRAATPGTPDPGWGRPLAGTVLLGLGLGGFVDGIVLHQILQWHHMLTSAGFPATTVANLELNTLADGLFHAATWLSTVAGLALLWGAARRRHVRWPAKLLWGGLLAGWGGFNVVEGVIDHHLLGLHHVNETAPPEQWLLWDLGFLALGAALLIAGGMLLQRGRREARAEVVAEPAPAGGRARRGA